MRFALTIFAMARRCFTTQLQPHGAGGLSRGFTRDQRSSDHAINSPRPGMYLWKLVWIARAIAWIDRDDVGLHLRAAQHQLELEEPLGLILNLIRVPLLYLTARTGSVVIALLIWNEEASPMVSDSTRNPLVPFDDADDSLSLHITRLAGDPRFRMVHEGIAPSTSSMSTKRSTPELMDR